MEERDSNVSANLNISYTESKSADICNSHLREDALSYLVFHGDGRPRLPQRIIENDIVLTTYATLVADYKGSKVLQKVHWFRVVLDEGIVWILPSSSVHGASLISVN